MDPHNSVWSLPLMLSVAEVLSCPHTHMYSPASSKARSRMCSSHTVPSCLRLCLFPSLSVSDPFLHATGATLLSSQRSVAVAPSVASSFFRPFMNLVGRATNDQAVSQDSRLQRPKCTAHIYAHSTWDNSGHGTIQDMRDHRSWIETHRTWETLGHRGTQDSGDHR